MMGNRDRRFDNGVLQAELQKRADRADQSVLFFLAGANFWEKHAKNRRKHAKTRENRQKTGAFLLLIFWGAKLVGANFYAFCNYALCRWRSARLRILTDRGGNKCLPKQLWTGEGQG